MSDTSEPKADRAPAREREEDNEDAGSRDDRRYREDRDDRDDRDDSPGEETPPRKRQRGSLMCYKWPQGTCTFGDRCRFEHDGPGGTTGSGGGGGGGRDRDRDRGRSGDRDRDRDGGGCDLFMRGLEYYMSEDEIRDEILHDCRGVSQVVLPVNRDNPEQNRGFAIVKFDSERDAKSALSKLNGIDCRGRSIFVRWSENQSGGGGGGGGGDSYGGGGYSRRDDRRDRDRGSGGRDRRDISSGACFRWAQSGSCRYGQDCRFSHDGSPRRGGGGGGGYDEYPRRDRDNRDYGRGGDRDYGRGGGGGGGGRSDACYSWQRTGSCSYGESCKFSHN